MTFIGVDPGDTGALIAIDDTGAIILALPLPHAFGSPDPVAARAAVQSLPRPWRVVIEKPISVPRKGFVDTGFLALKRSVKFWAGVLGEKNPYLVHPKTWQAAMLMGIQGATTKERSINWCRVFLPDLNLRPGKCTTDQDGLADAACIAEWCRRLAKVQR